MMTGKSVKDVDRYQAVLNSLLALEENKYCADCESKGRRFASVLMPVNGQCMTGSPSSFSTVEKCSAAFIFPRLMLYYGVTSSPGRRERAHGMQLYWFSRSYNRFSGFRCSV